MVVNKVHFIWIGSEQMPLLYQQGLQSFYSKHKTWNVHIWLQKDVTKIIERSKYNFKKCTSFINKYNFIKYHILAEHGGWFVDLDIFWKRSLDEIISDKVGVKYFPDIIVPVRNIPLQELNLKCNDDMLLYVKKDIFWELISFCENRTDYDTSLKYEPYGPVSLSMWLHSSTYTREYLYETEIQKDGYYCDHRNSKSWIFN